MVARCDGIPRTLETLVGTLRQRRTLTLARLAGDEAALQRFADNPARELYESLSAEERLLMQALAVFQRPVPEGAVQQVFPGIDSGLALERLVLNHAVGFDEDCSVCIRWIGNMRRGRLRRSTWRKCIGTRRRSIAACEGREAWRRIEDVAPVLEEISHPAAGCAMEALEALLLIHEVLQAWGHARQLIAIGEQLAPLLTEAADQERNAGHLRHGLLLRERYKARPGASTAPPSWPADWLRLGRWLLNLGGVEGECDEHEDGPHPSHPRRKSLRRWGSAPPGHCAQQHGEQPGVSWPARSRDVPREDAGAGPRASATRTWWRPAWAP